ncbi:hypothetical protein ACFQZE_11655 [Paenibacillus sp. GCM10027627]|uniref:hypothetical protein n=1 Tax=unclassified Paenibacillus TaxID=185978 RepID=UPI0036426F13
MSKITYADVAIISEGSRIYAGVELKTLGPDGIESYHVISWAGDLKTPSVKQAIPTILAEVLICVDQAHDTVIFRSFNRAFQRSTAIETAVRLYWPMTIKVGYVPYQQFIRRYGQNTLLLANDAIRRGRTLSVKL